MLLEEVAAAVELPFKYFWGVKDLLNAESPDDTVNLAANHAVLSDRPTEPESGDDLLGLT